jgi:putative lipoic acid-binding regulatory protein
MNITGSTTSKVTVDQVVGMFRKLSFRERLKVIAIVVPEMEQDLPEKKLLKRKSLRGLWKDLNVHLTAEDIDQARKEMWANFPREDI